MPLKKQHQLTIKTLVDDFTRQKSSPENIATFLKLISDTTDQTLIDLWQSQNMPNDIALVAVGGYGRAELFPYSDVDVLILLPDQLDLEKGSSASEAIKTFISQSWDLGLQVGSSVRSVAQCLKEAAQDITIQTALLEARFITGDAALYQHFHDLYFQRLNPAEFIQGKLNEMRRRHQKYNNSPYALEPNCKESPGGLRDLHVIFWITQAAQLGKTWDELVKNGLLTELEKEQVKVNENWLKRLRAHLHLYSQRHEDRLVFDVQEEVALALGYQVTDSKRASEALMHDYYRTAKEIFHINHIFILSFSELFLSTQEPIPPIPLDDRFADRAGMLDIIDDDIYKKDPHQILRTFLLFAQSEGIKTFSLRTFRALHHALGFINDTFRNDPINQKTFIGILKASPDVFQAFRLMNQTNVLGAYLPLFNGIVGQMQHDLFHVYTVDQHTLMVLRNIRRFFMPEHAHEYPLCSEIAANFEHPWLIYIAALFHDIAKGRSGDHSQLGAQNARAFAKQHGLSAEETDLVVFLVSEHLTMSHTAQKEDITNPEVIQQFVGKVKDKRHLNALYLLTVADIRGTSPKVWNSWKSYLLEQLYQQSLHMLGGHAPEPQALVNTRKRMALEILKQTPFQQGQEEKLWQTFNISYFLRYEADEIAWHTRILWDKVTSLSPIVRVRKSNENDTLQVMVYTPDRPDLFARICGFFSITDLNIVDARIHTSTPHKKGGGKSSAERGWALDTFQLIPAALATEATEQELDTKRLEEMITHDLQKTLESDAPLPPPRAARTLSRRARYFPLPPVIDLQPDENHDHWLLSITAGDRIGLLYAVARVLAEMKISVELARISTLGDRAEDTFLISSPMLGKNHFQEELEHALFEAIQSPP